MKDLGLAKFFLGMKVVQTGQGIYLNQRKYVMDILGDVGLLGSKPITTPMSIGLNLHGNQSPLLQEVHQYGRVIGRGRIEEYGLYSLQTTMYIILSDLKVMYPVPIELKVNSQDVLHITSNPVFHEITKHLDIDCHIVRNQYLKGLINPQYVSSSEQVVDIFTKALRVVPFQMLESKLGRHSVFHPQLKEGM
ncbi:hypothetical protein LIER_28275 [Lithospermum erythrorhizon]|uniref:Reverse transcriptase Ty1/copia-type domain-containing protein n=1 Tax=Lithospermum erythrorhizon TaxID=34254 RepID=A0AAV3RFH7_LITER